MSHNFGGLFFAPWQDTRISQLRTNKIYEMASIVNQYYFLAIMQRGYLAAGFFNARFNILGME